ncbi:MAG TPA: DUF1588 domain-containing protein [Polyangiaceae bacterium]|nr:DUF1588 domain-containing protein [Polyangiaceae bacterium]
MKRGFLARGALAVAVAACVACGGEDYPALPEVHESGGTNSGGESSSSGGASSALGGGSSTAASTGFGGGSDVAFGGSGTAACSEAAPRRVRRLTLREVELTLTDLLATPSGTFAWSARDPKVQGFDTNADALTVAGDGFEDFVDVAVLAVQGADVTVLAPCVTSSDESCVPPFVADFAERAFGRPVTSVERQRLSDLYTSSRQNFDAGGALRLVLQAILSSPYFLYRSELGPSDAGTTTSLTPYEAANGLAFALTGARPDATLRARAKDDPDFMSLGALREEARRLSGTDRAKQQLLRFLRQWLGMDDLRSVNKIPALFPEFTPEVKADLDREVETYLSQALAPGAGTLSALLSGSFAYPSQTVFDRLYAGDYRAKGKDVPVAGAFTPIAFELGLRKGVIGLPAWLAAHSPVHRSSPVDRGLAIRNRFFCQSLPSPPANALSVAPGPGDEVATTRQKFEQHSNNDACRGCHQAMDPIGFGLEMMDAIGRYRDTENGLPVNSKGQLSGTDVDGPFEGPAELADKLLASRIVRDCFTVQMFRYVAGRDTESGDSCLLQALQRRFAADELDISGLAQEIAVQTQLAPRSFE